MRLHLNLDASWTATAIVDGEAAAFIRDDRAARLHTTPLVDRFAPAVANAEGVDVVSTTAARSQLGWPVTISERVITSPGATRRELEVRYAFFEYGASAIVSGPAERLAAARDALLAAALTGRPEWNSDGDVACLANLLPRT